MSTLKKVINTLKYGNTKTKQKIYTMLFFLVAGIGLLIAAIVYNNLVFGIFAIAIIFVDGLILANTSFEQKSISVKKGSKLEKELKTEEEEETGALEWLSSEKKEKKEKKVEDEEPGALEWLSSEKREKKEKKEEESPLAQYDDKKLKKLFVKYKVKKEHVTILIDECRAEKIYECPAYMWKDRAYLYFLLLEKEARMIKFPYKDIGDIVVRRGVLARPAEEYQELQENRVIQMIFGNLLPKYYQKEKSYRKEYQKNLYSVGLGIWCTSGSVSNMLKILPSKFSLEDNRLDNMNSYYKEIYIARILFFDGILSPKQYKEKVLETLSALVKSDLSDGTIQDYLSQMMMTGLLPKEYVDFALSKRR